VVEATEGCSINQGKCAKAGQVHKICEQILSTCVIVLVILKTRENFSKLCIINMTENIKTSLTCLEIFMQNGKVGEGDVFFKENNFIALVA
jgi:hypothetical protein